MTGRLAGKVAIITGGASGIGRASALRFLAEGARVLVADVNERNGQQTAQLARSVAPAEHARFVRCDVSEESEVVKLVQHAIERFGRLDCMFNNAGLPGAVGPLTDVSVEDWDRTFAVMVRGGFLGIKHAALAMRAQGGCILNT